MSSQVQERSRQSLGHGLGNGQQQQTPSWAALEQMLQTQPSEFGNEIKRRWGACEQVAQLVIQLVESGELEVQVGFGIISCALGQTFSYSAFHEQPTVADVISLVSSKR